MKRGLRKFFSNNRTKVVTVKDISTICKFLKRNDRVVLERGNDVIVITNNYVEVGTKDGEWFHTVINRLGNDVYIVRDIIHLLKTIIDNWEVNLLEEYEKGLNQPHPLVIL